MATDGGLDLGVEDGGDGVGGELDLRALAARVQQLEETQRVIQKRQRAIVETLDRDLRFAAKELRGLLA